jgi:Tol biopolymer transport system component
MRANGAEKRPVYGGKLDPADGTYFPPWDLEWSADGDSILFTSDKGPLSDDLARYRLELAPTGAARPARQRLTEGGDRFGTAQREVYSRVNKTSVEICYTESDCLYNGHLVVIDERGKRRLMRSDYDEAEPAWSPSGETIAFARGWPYKERYRIYVVSPTGFSLRPVTP